MEKLKRIPAGDLQEKLRLGFEGLRDEMEKEIFLDVCCYFVGMKEELVVKIMDGCGMYGESGLRGLKWRCLIGVEIGSGRLKMHDLVRDMGREIVRQSCVKQPGRRSRIWFHREALHILANQTVTILYPKSSYLGSWLDSSLCTQIDIKDDAYEFLRILFVNIEVKLGNSTFPLLLLFIFYH